jgi:tetratricopeptide (TPR) repeat protein
MHEVHPPPKPQLYGRGKDLKRLAECEKPVCIVTGDTGIGKTALLVAGLDAPGGIIAPEPRTVAHGDGSLHRSLLASLSHAIALADTGSDVHTLGRRLVRAARRAAKGRLERLPEIIGAEIIRGIRDHVPLGKEAIEAFEEVLAALREDGDEELRDRIRAAAIPEATGVVGEIALEVASMTAGKPLVLSVDAGERLSPGDQALLLDLADWLGKRGGDDTAPVRIRIGFATRDQGTATAADRLRMHPRIGIVELDGLEVQAIEHWLSVRQQNIAWAARIQRSTSGSPFAIVELLNRLADGESIDSVLASHRDIDRVRPAWEGAADDVRTHARRLAVLTDPPPEQTLHRLLQLDEAETSTAVEVLQRSRLFGTRVNGQPWFHELARMFILREVLDEQTRVALARSAARIIADYIEAEAAFELLGELESLVDVMVAQETRETLGMLLRLGGLLANAGEFRRSEARCEQAIKIANSLQLPDELGRASLGFAGRHVFEAVTANTATTTMLSRAREKVDPRHGALHTRLTAALAQSISFTPHPDVLKRALAEQAEREARAAGDPDLLAEVLFRTGWAIWTPDNLAERRLRANEVVELADATDDSVTRMDARLARIAHSLEAGDIETVDDDVATCSTLAASTRLPPYLALAHVARATLCALRGKFDESHRETSQALEIGRRNPSYPNAGVLQLYGIQLLCTYTAWGRLEDIRPSAEQLTERFRSIPAWATGLAVIYAELGRHDDAQCLLDHLAENGFAAIPFDAFWLGCLEHLSRVCTTLGDEEKAALLYDLMAPYADRFVVTGLIAACYGSVSANLGALASLLGRDDVADRHFEEAIERNADIDARAALAYSHYEYGKALQTRNGDATRALAAAQFAEARRAATDLGMGGLHLKIDLATQLESEPVTATRPGLRARARRKFSRGTSIVIRHSERFLVTEDPEAKRIVGPNRAARLLLDALPRFFQRDSSAGFTGEIALHLMHPDESVTTWTIEVLPHGKPRGREGGPNNPHDALAIRMQFADFVRFLGGGLNGAGAWIDGGIGVETGDPATAARLPEMFGGRTPFDDYWKEISRVSEAAPD